MTHTNPRGTHLRIADAIREAVTRGEYTEQLPSVSELTRIHGASRSVIHRALHLLKNEGILEPVKGVAWYVARTGDRRPVDIRMREMILTDHYAPGEKLASEAQLCLRLNTSRVTVRKALAQLEGEGLLSPATPHGRTVLALPADKEHP